MEVKLVYFRQDGTRRDFPLVKASSVLGRRDDCDLRIPLIGVSRQHCEVVLIGDELSVKDMGSSNGTCVNQRRVDQQQLTAGDHLQVGPVILTVQIDGKPSEIAPPGKAQAMAAGPAADQTDDVELAANDDDAFADMVMSDDDEDPMSALEALAEEDDQDTKDQ